MRYSSSDESVATIDPITGEITRLAVGSTTITAAISGDATYPDTADSYILTITDSREEVTLVFDKWDVSCPFRLADEFVWPTFSALVDNVADDTARYFVRFYSSNEDVVHVDEVYGVHEIQGPG